MEIVMTESFEGRKLIVVGGSSGMGRQTAAEVVAGGGSAVIIGRNQERVDETVMTLSAKGQGMGHHRRPRRP
jgi:NAD(P)-dependent dehydrogenase (short-subunit alcohol dehydrogenase family)